MTRLIRDLVFETGRSSVAGQVRVYLAADEGELLALDARARLGLVISAASKVRFVEDDRELRVDLPKWLERLGRSGQTIRRPGPKPAVSRLAAVRRARLRFFESRERPETLRFGVVPPLGELRRPGFVLDLELGEVELDEGLEKILRLAFPVVRVIDVSVELGGRR